MTWLERFLEYSKKELWEVDMQDIFAGADSVADVDRTLFAYASFKIDLAKNYAREKLKDEIAIEPKVRLDHEEHKNFEIDYITTYRLGGRYYEIIIDSDQCYAGKICEGTTDFENEIVAGVRSLLKNYFHVCNHVRPELDEKAYNPARDFRPEPRPLDGFLEW